MAATIQGVWDEFNKRLSQFGQVVLAGGSVRDHLLGRAAKDFDVFVLQGTDFDFEKAVEHCEQLELPVPEGPFADYVICINGLPVFSELKTDHEARTVELKG